MFCSHSFVDTCIYSSLHHWGSVRLCRWLTAVMPLGNSPLISAGLVVALWYTMSSSFVLLWSWPLSLHTAVKLTASLCVTAALSVSYPRISRKILFLKWWGQRDSDRNRRWEVTWTNIPRNISRDICVQVPGCSRARRKMNERRQGSKANRPDYCLFAMPRLALGKWGCLFIMVLASCYTSAAWNRVFQ